MTVKLELLRFELDLVDDQVVDILIGRFRRLERVAKAKLEDGVPPHDPARERLIAKRLERRMRDVSPEVRDAIGEIMKTVVMQGRLHVRRSMLSTRHDSDDEDLDAERRRAPDQGS